MLLTRAPMPVSVAQLDAPSDWRPGGRGVAGSRVQPPPRSAKFVRGE